MKVYVLTTICTNRNVYVSTRLFLSEKAAQAEIQNQIDATLELYKEEIDKGWMRCSNENGKAYIRNGSSSTTMEISEKELPVEMVIHLHGGLVQNVYSTADIRPEVYDTDSDDEELEEEIEQMQKRLDEIEADPNWLEVR